MAYMLIFLLKKCEYLLHLQKLLNFYSKNTCDLDIVLTRTVNILTTNELVKLKMIRTTGPRGFVCVEVLRPSQPNGVMLSAVSLPNHTFTGQA